MCVCVCVCGWIWILYGYKENEGKTGWFRSRKRACQEKGAGVCGCIRVGEERGAGGARMKSNAGGS